MHSPEAHHDTGPVSYTVYPGCNGTYFWLYAEVTRINARGEQETSLEILLPRTPVEQLSTTQRKQYRETLGDANAQSRGAPPPPPRDRVPDSRHPILS